MAFSVSEFQSKINEHGLATTNVFILRITKIPAVLQQHIPASDLVFFCKTVDLPSLTLQTTDYHNQGFGAIERRPNALELPTLPTTFFVDSNHKVLKFFHSWMQAIVNYDVENGVLSEVDGRLPYEIAYRNDYVGEAEVLFYTPNYNKYYTYKFHNIYPIEAGSLTLSWEDNDNIAVLPVGFSYDTIKLDGSRSGEVVTNLNRGPGLFEYLYSLGTTANIIKGLHTPTSIQDAINQYTTVNRLISHYF